MVAVSPVVARSFPPGSLFPGGGTRGCLLAPVELTCFEGLPVCVREMIIVANSEKICYHLSTECKNDYTINETSTHNISYCAYAVTVKDLAIALYESIIYIGTGCLLK